MTKDGEIVRLGKYEIGRTLGEGNFGKVKHARRIDSGQSYAVKILERKRVIDLKIRDQIKREIGTLKLLRHPNVVRLYEVLASKTKIYMVLEYVTGGELFDKIALKGRLPEHEGRKLFQQLIDAVSYCHDKGVFHRDLKNDGLLHTTCGSPNYVAPEVLANRGYDGAKSDIWSCGVILYVILTGYLPFDDRNLAVLYQKIFKGEFQIPKWLSPGARNMIRRILDPNPHTRINVAQIKEDGWFKQDYVPVMPDEEEEEEDGSSDDEAFSIKEVAETNEHGNIYTHINAFELIGMSSSLDLSGFFEKEDVSERKIRFTSTYSPKDLFERIEDIVTGMGFQVHKCHGKLKVMQQCKGSTTPQSLSVAAEVFELSPSLYVVELRKSHGDSSLYRQLCAKLSDDLGVCGSSQQLLAKQSLMPEFTGLEEEPVVAM
ncbi:CBL-interacting protein kinase 1 [Cocos nucifera]|uniref:non-specific serine/threonine protein kinase n=1 Tax=Cocos nucifera TaxID=13894 RepID=A0A8K0MTZ6_COCNU|nr:CBL-interacting protein kinase 1 [Cocos nucifera]